MRIRTSTVIGVVVAIVVVWAGVAIGAFFALPNWEARGQFGDVFGAVNALFSGLAFAGLITAILLQREDLELQREELTLTRKELSRSAQAQEQSEAALKSQAEAAGRSARLATVNFLISHYQQELRELRGNAYRDGDPRLQRLRELSDREAKLLRHVEALYQEVIQHEQPDQPQDR